MGGLLASALLVVGSAAASSLLLCLPVMVAAESLVGREPATARRFWHVVAALPLILGLLLTELALLTLTGDITASPHQERIRPHLCLALLTGLPDAPFRFRLYATLALGLLVFALVRFVLGVVRSRVPAGLPEVVEVDAAAPLCFSLGVTRPVIVCSTGLRRLLTEEERAAVLAHERAHGRHRDAQAELLLRLATDPLLWLPTTHYYLRQARAARELLSDEAAAAETSAGALRAALEKMAQAAVTHHRRQEGDLAGLRPVFPDYADPQSRLRALADESEASLAPGLGVIVTIEVVLLAVLVGWQWRPLHDTLHCVARSLLDIMRR
ncbi:MAG: M56 family metallopeptidase [Armatimonadetes bacterium]|nr:M56 family metallopeptidase [Armatimonadota bacterium]